MAASSSDPTVNMLPFQFTQGGDWQRWDGKQFVKRDPPKPAAADEARKPDADHTAPITGSVSGDWAAAAVAAPPVTKAPRWEHPKAETAYRGAGFTPVLPRQSYVAAVHVPVPKAMPTDRPASTPAYIPTAKPKVQVADAVAAGVLEPKAAASSPYCSQSGGSASLSAVGVVEVDLSDDVEVEAFQGASSASADAELKLHFCSFCGRWLSTPVYDRVLAGRAASVPVGQDEGPADGHSHERKPGGELLSEAEHEARVRSLCKSPSQQRVHHHEGRQGEAQLGLDTT